MAEEQKGIFIVLEGADGSGKGTQFRLLTERLRAVGYDVEVFDFPRYDQPSSHFVRSYLNGEYGPAANISPYTASMFYALDRYEAAPQIKKALAAGKIVLANRYVGSNMAHQGGKFSNQVEQRGFFVWADSLEFQLLGIPRPTLNFFLHVPAETAYELIGKKKAREYTTETHDEHEKDINHLRNSVATYDTLCKLFPKDFKAIECVQDGKLLSVAAINNKIWDVLHPMLPAKPPNSGHEAVVNLDDTDEPQRQDKQEVNANPSDNSSNEDITIDIKKVSLLVASEMQIVPEISTTITSIEWPQKKQYDYYNLARLPKNAANSYKDSMKKLADLHQQIQKSLNKALSGKSFSIADNPLSGIIPMSALCEVKVKGNVNAFSRLISKLQASSLEEARWLSEQLHAGAQQLRPDSFKAPSSQISKPKNNTLKEVITRISKDQPFQGLSGDTNPVTMLEARPRNEFDLLIDVIYPFSNLSRNDLSSELAGWNYEQKQEALTVALNSTENPALAQAQYRWNIIADRLALDDLLDDHKMEGAQPQPATPRYGYEIPELIEQLGLEEEYMECFDESLKAFSNLQENNLEDIAPYCTLLGHKIRWQLNTSAQDLAQLSVSPKSSAKYILDSMKEKAGEVHPLISEAISKSVRNPINSTGKMPEKRVSRSASKRSRKSK